ncbi:MAG: OmpA family protein [Sulfurimonas sp.]|nr:OmpA family protein [Sulfurimonas sp.]
MKNTLFLLLLFTSLFANKSDYSIIVKKPFNAALFDITQDYDRTLSSVGFSKDYKNNSKTALSYSDPFDYLASMSHKFGSQMHIIKVDKTAKILLSKVSNLPNFNEAIAVVKTPSNGYFVGGYTLDGSLLILKLDANANILYSKSFGTKNYDRMNNLVLMSDGGVLAVGSSFTSRSTSDDMFNTGLGNNDIFITRFNKNGQKLWSKKYGTIYDDRGIDAVEARDGSIIVVGTTSYEKSRDVNIMRLTENGNRVWLKHYQEKENDDNTVIPKKIIRLRDNNFVLVLTQYNHMQKEHIRIIKFDLYQNILIDKEIFTTYPSEINDIKEYSDGKFIAVGYVKDTYNTDGLAMILDSNFILLTQEHYGQENYDVFNGVTIMHNSQAGVAGVHTDNSSQETNMWITKLNRDATMAQVSINADSFYEKLLELFKKEITEKKIKIKKDLSINITDPKLYFKVGEYRLTKEQKEFISQLSSKLIPFMYANKEDILSLEINGHTSSEWGKLDFADTYLNNEKLSLNRSYEVVNTLFKTQSKKQQLWLTKVLRASGYSSAKPISHSNIESKKKSRRVNLKIILKDIL